MRGSSPSVIRKGGVGRRVASQGAGRDGGGRSRGLAVSPAFAGHGLRSGLGRDWMKGLGQPVACEE
jgi:hypothetical protein